MKWLGEESPRSGGSAASGNARPGSCGSERFWSGAHLGRIGESVCIPALGVLGLWLLLFELDGVRTSWQC